MDGTWRRRPAEKYTWFFLDISSAWGISLLFTLVGLALSIGIFVLYTYLSHDLVPDSLLGYTYAIIGTLFMFLAVLGYSRYRRSHKRNIGQLNGCLHWHISFGIIALVLLFLHSFGNFNPRTGTYALYGMIALVISGIIGRALDRMVPKLIAHDLKRMLTEAGETGVEFDTHPIWSTVSYNEQEFESQDQAAQSEVTGFTKPLMIPWDLAYVSLEETPRKSTQTKSLPRIVPNSQVTLVKPVTTKPGVEEHSDESPDMHNTFSREVFHLAIIRYWRIGHMGLAFLTLGLILWHLEYVATLLFPVFFQYTPG